MSLKAIRGIATESIRSTHSNITEQPDLLINFAVTNLTGAWSNKSCQCMTNKHQNLYSMDRQRVDKTLNNLNLIEPHQGLPSFEGKIFPIGVIPLQKLLDKEYEIKSS